MNSRITITVSIMLILFLSTAFFLSVNSTDFCTAKIDTYSPSTHVSVLSEISQDVLLDPFIIMVLINDNGTTILKIDAEFWNVGTSTITTLYLRVDSLLVETSHAYINGSSVSVSTERTDRYVELSMDLEVPLEHNEHVSVNVELVANDLQSEPALSDDGFYFSRSLIYYLRPLNPVNNFTFIAVLPPHSSLYSESVAPLFPSPSANMTDGESLVFFWHLQRIQPGQEQVYIIRYEMPSVRTSSDFQAVYLLSAFSLFTGFAIAFILPRILRKVRYLRRVQYVGVTRAEQELIVILKEKGGSCPQKILATELDVSQAKISIMLKSLEERGLIRRFKDGRENMVHLLES